LEGRPLAEAQHEPGGVLVIVRAGFDVVAVGERRPDVLDVEARSST
jgi:hypothetical protein